MHPASAEYSISWRISLSHVACDFTVRMHSKFLGVWFYAVYTMLAVHAHAEYVHICVPVAIWIWQAP